MSPARTQRRRRGGFATLLAIAGAACSTTPNAAELQRADLGDPPSQQASEAAARQYLDRAGTPSTTVRFAPLERGGYRIDTIGGTRIAWHLPATVGTAANDGIACSFWFERGQLVAVGAMQPLHNRTTVADGFVVTAIAADGRPTSGRYLQLGTQPAPAAR